MVRWYHFFVKNSYRGGPNPLGYEFLTRKWYHLTI
jgi:hypothetical protein